ncbi:hypothetical protein [Brevundimonas mediterranea]|uniref:hypothetical protein n=1 Tax=Brevundimonas mediterranea TaxID=74329 RepID=UPI0012B6878E|nr:hypothetical protein [Brevundimonas mediterranea]
MVTGTDSLKSHLDNLRSTGSENIQKVVQKILEDPNVHVFGEFLQEPVILQVGWGWKKRQEFDVRSS